MSATSDTVQGGASIRELRSQYYVRSGLPVDGGVEERWVKATTGRVPLYFLNTAPRRRAVPYHDVHHVLTRYETTSTGEAEIGAWELGAGTRPHWMATVLDLAAVGTGLFIAPRRTFRAFVRGRRCSTLYREPLTDELLDSPAEQVRARLGIDAPSAPATTVDALCFAAIGLAGFVTLAAFFAFAPLLLPIGLLMQ